MIGLFLLSFIVITSYLGITLATIGIQPSLSATYYKITPKWLFQLAMGTVGISMMIFLLDFTEGKWYQFMSFLSTAAFIFVAFTPDFKRMLEGRIHKISAGVSAVFSLILILLTDVCFWVLPATLLIIALLISKQYGNRIFWLEMAIFSSVYVFMFSMI